MTERVCNTFNLHLLAGSPSEIDILRATSLHNKGDEGLTQTETTGDIEQFSISEK